MENCECGEGRKCDGECGEDCTCDAECKQAKTPHNPDECGMDTGRGCQCGGGVSCRLCRLTICKGEDVNK